MNSLTKSAAILSILSIAGAVPVMAQQAAPTPGTTMPMQGMTMPTKPGTGDADRDFVGMMIPHHQGAIDMAKYELAHGKDPAMLRLARAIVAAQDKEIAEMNAWQAKHPSGR